MNQSEREKIARAYEREREAGREHYVAVNWLRAVFGVPRAEIESAIQANSDCGAECFACPVCAALV